MNIAVVFPGQGSQNKDMADSFSDVSSFNDVIDQGSEILNYDVVAAEHYYLSGLASIKEENYTRIYNSLVSLQRLSDKNKNIYETYVNLNNKILIFLSNRN